MKRTLKWICVFLIGALTVIMFSPQKHILYPKRYQAYVEKYSRFYGVDPNLVYSVMKAESGFFPYATSPKGAMGLMQITKPTLEWIESKADIKLENPYHIEKNIQAGTWYLSLLNKQFGDLDLVIIAYNAGPGKTKEWLKEGKITKEGEGSQNLPYEETSNYIVKVKKNYEEYSRYYKK